MSAEKTEPRGNDSKRLISVVIPVYNNEKTLMELAMRLFSVLKDRPYELLFINDGSRDRSLEVLKELTLKYSQVRVISFSRNFGQHPAISAGFEYARGDILVLMDADLQDRPENLPLLLGALSPDVDIVYSLRKDHEKEYFKNLTSNAFHAFVARQIGVTIPQNIGTYRVFRRKVLEAMLKYHEVNILYGPLMYSIGFSHTYVEIERDERSGSRCSYTFLKRMSLAINTVVSYTDSPCRVLLWIGASTSLLSMAYAVLASVQYFIGGQHLPTGLTLVVVLLSALLGIVIFGIGILGIYLFRTFQEVLRRPRYLVGETYNLEL